MSITGDYRSLAEACGEAPWQLAGYEPSHTWTGSELAEMHPDDLEGVHLVMENDRHRTMERLERENAELRSALEALKEHGIDVEHIGRGTFVEGGEDAHLDAAYEDRFDTEEW